MRKLNFYRANKSNSGCAISFNFGADKKGRINLYLNAIKQFSWDAKTGKGSFSGNAQDPSKKLTMKIEDIEIGNFLDVLSGGQGFSMFHKNDRAKSSTRAYFSPFIAPKIKDLKSGSFVDNVNGIQTGYSLSVSRDSTLDFKVMFTMGEGQLLAEYLKVGIREKFLTDETYESEESQQVVEESVAETF